MAEKGDVVAWQENKSLLERQRYLLDSEIATDVSFTISPPDSKEVTIVRAHKAFLVAASPVFEAMFCGGMVEARSDCGNIKIPDIDVETFKELLSFIYTETVNVNASTALPLMYAAKKYLVPGLVAKCSEVLENELGVDNVCAVLQQITVLGDDQLKATSLRFICKNSEKVLATEGFLHLSRDAVEEVASLDTLHVATEEDLFGHCVKWAKYQLQSQGKDATSDELIREELGCVLYKIRFPAMNPRTFAKLTAHSNILTKDEKHDIYVFMNSGEKLETLAFMTDGRFPVESSINHFECVGEPAWNCDGPPDAISLETTADIHLSAIGLYGGVSASSHDVTIEVFRGGDVLSTTKVTQVTSDGSQTPIRIEIERVLLRANTRYDVVATIKGPGTWRGTSGRDIVETSEFRVKFYKCDRSKNGSKPEGGQIPQLFYCLA